MIDLRQLKFKTCAKKGKEKKNKRNERKGALTSSLFDLFSESSSLLFEFSKKFLAYLAKQCEWK